MKPLLILGATLVLCGVAALFLNTSATPAPPAPPPPPPKPAPLATLEEAFDKTLERWAETSEGDFKEKSVDIQNGRLRLRCGTIGTDDKTVKFLGARSASAVAFGQETRVSAELDWNDQANGSYLSAALILAPGESTGNPLTQPDWIKVEYVGVPPGRNGRLAVSQRVKGRDMMPYTEGWPQTRREGRPIKLQKIELVIRGGLVEVWENGQKVHETKEKVPFDKAHLYLQMSSHSNYPPRELFWDNVRVAVAE